MDRYLFKKLLWSRVFTLEWICQKRMKKWWGNPKHTNFTRKKWFIWRTVPFWLLLSLCVLYCTVPSRFAFYCLYVYCAVCYSRFKVDPVLEMVHLVYCPVLTFIVCMCTVQYAIAGLKATRYLKRTKSVLC